MIDSKISLQLFFGPEFGIDSGAAGFCSAEWRLMSVDVIIPADVVRKTFVEIIACREHLFRFSPQYLINCAFSL